MFYTVLEIAIAVAATAAVYVSLVAPKGFFGFIQSEYITRNVAMQYASIKVSQDPNSTEEEHDPVADAFTKAAGKLMNRQAKVLEAIAGIWLLWLWVLTIVGLRAKLPIGRNILKQHSAFTKAQQSAAADAIRAQRLQQLALQREAMQAQADQQITGEPQGE